MNALPATIRIEALLHALVLPCLQEPELLQIRTGGSDSLPIFAIGVSRCDAGRIIGRRGSNLFSLKALLGAVGTAQGIACGVTVYDLPPTDPCPRTEAWSVDAVSDALSTFLSLCNLPTAVGIAHEHEAWYSVMVGTILPDDLTIPLGRWLSVMGAEGSVRFTLNEPASTL